jgi:hypothetical protein
MSTPIKPIPVAVGDKILRLKMSNLATYRLQKYSAAMFGGEKNVAALIDWCWCLDSANTFPSAEALAAYCTDEDLNAMSEGISKAIDAAEQKPDPT